MARDVRPVLSEIRDALDGIEAATRGKSLDDFRSDWLLKHGVQRGIEIISEAVRHLPDEVLATASDVPWLKIKGIGSVLRHEYHKVSDPIVWAVVTDHLPPLRQAIDAIAASLPSDGQVD